MNIYFRSVIALVSDALFVASVGAETVALLLDEASHGLTKWVIR